MNYRRGSCPASWVTREKCSSLSPASIGSLKANGLITSPAHILLAAGNEFDKKTMFVHEMWQTDFTYFKILGWGWYYLSTILDDYSRYIVHWELCDTMKAGRCAVNGSSCRKEGWIEKRAKTDLLSDNGFVMYPVNWRNIYQLWGSDQYTDVLPIRRHR